MFKTVELSCTWLFVVCLGTFTSGCHHPNGAHTSAGNPTDFPPNKGAVKMVHQIVFDNLGKTKVFDGFMIKQEESYVIRAFAGPGLDLFTVKRHGAHHSETLHLESLADKIQMNLVGEDIGRVYQKGCPLPPEGSLETTCLYFLEPLKETYHLNGALRQRFYPDAYGVGITISYEEYRMHSGELLPTLIRVSWGDGSRSMTIKTVQIERIDSVDPSVFVD